MVEAVRDEADRRSEQPVRVGRASLRIEDVMAVAGGHAQVSLDADPAYRRRLADGPLAVERALRAGEPIYGVSTGVGASLGNAIPHELRDALPVNLMRFHGCGTGRILGETEAAAVVAVRLASLARGWSGVRPELLERMCELLNRRVLPRIPEEGSVGASGDLTPLSYLAAALAGEREVSFRGEVVPASEGLARAGLAPLTLGPKESLAIMNGTSVMAALGCVAFTRARRLARWAAALTAVGSDVMRGNSAHYDARIFDLKPHPGTQRAAAWIRADLARAPGAQPADPARLQDRYSLRCAPHVIGVLLDALDFARAMIEIEVNGVSDNPLVDPTSGDVLHGGNFYGGHLCFVLDGLKAAVASVADLIDRQLCLVCDPTTSAGLPANLVAASGPSAVVHHGFKAMQITSCALTAEAQKLTMPASAFSRSTESHNQDKVSMGTIAARDCLRVLELAETVASVHTLAVCQAVDLRNGLAGAVRSRALRDAVRKAVPMNVADRRQDWDITRVLALHEASDLLADDLAAE
jgi:histidine ammonia-lyase